MREYALHQAASTGNLPGAGLIIRLVNYWHARKAVARLDELDDHLLHDIGITRADIDQLRHLPMTENPLAVLHERTRQHRNQLGAELYREHLRSSPAHFSAVRPG